MSESDTGCKGNGRTQLVNLKDALQLIIVLSGEMAKAVRVQISEILTDFFKGEESFLAQIRASANAASDPLICGIVLFGVCPQAFSGDRRDCALTLRHWHSDSGTMGKQLIDFRVQIAAPPRACPTVTPARGRRRKARGSEHWQHGDISALRW